MSKTVVFSREPLPREFLQSIFLAGPTFRKEEKGLQSWRMAALSILDAVKYEGVVYVPEDRDGTCGIDDSNYRTQIAWELEAMKRADCILFWVPRDLEKLPGFTTNTEWGMWYRSGKVVFGAPVTARKVGYQKFLAEQMGVVVHTTLRETIDAAVAMVKTDANNFRKGALCNIPLHIWKKVPFQKWLKEQRADGAVISRVEVGGAYGLHDPMHPMYIWTLHAELLKICHGKIYIMRANIALTDASDVRTVISSPVIELDEIELEKIKKGEK